MSETQPEPPEDDIDLLAAEYVLGLRGVDELAEILPAGPAFGQAVRRWETHLLPLAEALPQAAPPRRLWGAIDRATRPGATHSGKTATWWDNLAFWRGFGCSAAAAAVALLVILVLQPAPPVPVAAATLATAADGTFIATAEHVGGGTQLIVAPTNVKIPAGKSAELWLLPGSGKAASLGLLTGDRARLVALPAGALSDALAISLEPPGGSPTGQHTGPIISVARFNPI